MPSVRHKQTRSPEQTARYPGGVLLKHNNVICDANVTKEQVAQNCLVEKDKVQYSGCTSLQCSDAGYRQSEIQIRKTYATAAAEAIEIG